jgi:hypothetical protein
MLYLIYMHFSNAQLKLVSEIIGNIAVAWFATGIVSPIFIGLDTKIIILSIVTGSSLCLAFSVFALTILKDIE